MLTQLRRLAVILAGTCLISAVPLTSRAEESSLLRTAIDDTEEYFTSPVRWDAEDWTMAGIAVAAVASTHAFDARIRDHFAPANGGLNGGQDSNSLRDALPAVALIGGTLLAAGWIDDSDGYKETLRLLEAGVFSTVTAEALTVAAGRERPDGTTSPNRWRQGDDSFPSVHSSAAFAIGMTFAESGNDDYRWIRRIVGYAVAGGTAYVRVKDNLHWASDTVAGAAIGIATARFVLNREQGNHAQVAFAPQKGGWMLSYTVPLH
jgi:membrane-associated phospholipid phosphatase